MLLKSRDGLGTPQVQVYMVSIFPNFSLAETAAPVTAFKQVLDKINENYKQIDFLGVSDKGELCEVMFGVADSGVPASVYYVFWNQSTSSILDDSQVASSHYENLDQGKVDALNVADKKVELALTLKSGEKFAIKINHVNSSYAVGRLESGIGACNLKRRLVSLTRKQPPLVNTLRE